VHKLIPFLSLFLLSASAIAQSSLLQCGPMVGYAETNKVLLWVQTNAPATVKFKYWEKENSLAFKYTSEDSALYENGLTVKAMADHLMPGRTYHYELYINGEPVKIKYPLQFKSAPLQVPDTFRVALGSCASYSESDEVNEIFISIAARNPDMMVWLGDNVYLSKTDCESKKSIINAYTKSRSRSQMQPLLGAVHHYAVWDDHDYGPDNSDGTFYNKEITREAFKLFWTNSYFGINGKGITTSFNWGKVDFFLMDDRYFRAPKKRKHKERSFLGPIQLQWLLDSLKESKALFKFITVGNQILPAGFVRSSGCETYSGYYKKEQKYLLRKIKEENITGVFFISGDRHFSELSRKKRFGNYPLYDLTVSPLTSQPITNELNINFRRVRKTMVTQRNFAILEFFDDKNGEQMKIILYDSKGKILWEQIISAKDLT
jgi:alkaline phosphatase D